MASATTPTAAAAYWCYTCTRTVSVIPGGGNEDVVCPHCDGGFVQAVDPTDFSLDPLRRLDSPRAGPGRRRRNGLSFNPLIVLRSPTELEPPPDEGGGMRSYELYYNDGVGSGLRPLPWTMSESLLGSGFELMLDHLSQIGFTLWNRPENPPASKKAVESLPVLEILSTHVSSDLHCAVCFESFSIGSEAREMPCKHIYHSECILPWLSLRNSCPVCRYLLPTDAHDAIPGRGVGLTIWRLPGGGFAVGRFAGGREVDMPAVYSEMDGNLSFNGGARWGNEMGPWIRRRTVGGRIRRFFDNFGSFFRRTMSDSSTGSGHSFFRRDSLGRRRRRGLVSLE
ncbi:E3 ubiquitin-protein ligase RDUF2-like [Primulina huaijiensis]|uniref:E3 ubiquitin-protein ligase RDUF2-like n=1 Tax=Primulina huaijiensis TaxID=1492673 RepID=UPI003CC76217